MIGFFEYLDKEIEPKLHRKVKSLYYNFNDKIQEPINSLLSILIKKNDLNCINEVERTLISRGIYFLKQNKHLRDSDRYFLIALGYIVLEKFDLIPKYLTVAKLLQPEYKINRYLICLSYYYEFLIPTGSRNRIEVFKDLQNSLPDNVSLYEVIEELFRQNVNTEERLVLLNIELKKHPSHPKVIAALANNSVN